MIQRSRVFSSVEEPDPHQVLSNQELQLNADMHAYFEKQQQKKYDRDTVELFDSLSCPERVDLMEVCAPWDSPLSEAVERLGGTTIRLGLHNGFDMSTKTGPRKALALLRRVKPRYVHVSPPCFPFSIIQNANQRTPEQEDHLESKRNHGRKILDNCCKLLEVQIQELGCQGGFSHDGEICTMAVENNLFVPCLGRNPRYVGLRRCVGVVFVLMVVAMD